MWNRGQNDEPECEDNDSDMPPLIDMSDDEEEPVNINTPTNRDNYNGTSSVSDRVAQNTCATTTSTDIIDLTGVNQTPSPDSTKRVDHTALSQNTTTIYVSLTESMKNAKIECESEVLVASEWDETMDALEPTHLVVQQSKYRACNEYKHVVSVGRALTCDTIIKPDKESAHSMGPI